MNHSSVVYPSGTRLISRFRQGMHTMRYVQATVLESAEASYVIEVGPGSRVTYSAEALHQDFAPHASAVGHGALED